MDWILLLLLAVGSVAGFCYGVYREDESIIELSDDKAEECRKKLIEREEQDVELDKE